MVYPKVANIRERFINSTEYTLTFLKEMKKVEIGIGFRLERFNRNFLVSIQMDKLYRLKLIFNLYFQGIYLLIGAKQTIKCLHNIFGRLCNRFYDANP